MAIQWLRAKAQSSLGFMTSPLGRFLLAQNVSELGTELDRAGLRILFVQALGEVEALKAIGLVESVPFLFATFLAFPLGTIAGRMSLRRAALSVNLLLGVATLGMFGFQYVPLAVAVQVVRRCGDSFFGAVYNRAITTVAPGVALVGAQQLATLSGQATKQVSLLVGVGLVGVVGTGIFGLNALTFLAAALLFASLDRPAEAQPSEAETSALAVQNQEAPAFWPALAEKVQEIVVDMRVGLRYAFTHSHYLAALGLFTAIQINLAAKIAGVALMTQWALPTTHLGYYEAVAMLGEILVMVGVNLLRRRGVLLFTRLDGTVKIGHIWVASVVLALTMVGTGLSPNAQVGFTVKAIEGAATILCCLYAQSALTLMVPPSLIATLSGFIELWRAMVVGSASLVIGIYAGQLGALTTFVMVGVGTAGLLLLAAPLLFWRRG